MQPINRFQSAIPIIPTQKKSSVSLPHFGEQLAVSPIPISFSETLTETLWTHPSNNKPLVLRKIQTIEGTFLVTLLAGDQVGGNVENDGRFPSYFGLSSWQNTSDQPRFERLHENNIVAEFNEYQLETLYSALRAAGYSPTE